VPGHQDDGRRGALRPDRGEHFEAAGIGQLLIEQDDVDSGE
jgi:hypothetical protein